MPGGPESRDWEELKRLHERLERSGALLPADVDEALLRRVARQLQIPEAQVDAELMRDGGVARLVTEARRRIRDGSQRLMRAISNAQRALSTGDRAEARRVLEQVLDVEVVPYYRAIAEEELRVLGLA